METSKEWIVCSAECNICAHKWVAVVEVERIGEIVELPENLQCPNCEYMNSDYEILEPENQ